MMSSTCQHLLMAMFCLCCSLVFFGAPNAYNHFMGGKDKMFKIYKMILNFSFMHPCCANHLQCPNNYCAYMYHNEGFATATNGLD